MSSWNVRSMVTGFVASLALALAAGCTNGDVNPPKEVVSQSQQEAIIITPPSCSSNNTKWVHAHRHTASSGEAGYTRAFPNNTGVATVDNYERSLWNIPHTDGYEYLVDNTFWTAGCAPGIYTTCVPVAGTALVYLVGILDSNASPAYNMSPPSPANVRTPWTVGGTFWASSYDYSTELTLSQNVDTAAPGHAPLNSSHGVCVGILDESNNFIDYFPLVDIHDPAGHNW